MKSMMILLDGIQDIGYPQLGGKTPKEAGAGESFARLERESASARFSTSAPGRETDTLVCTLVLLGFTADMLPKGRSGLEALAEGLEIGADDLVMRCSFVKLDSQDRITDPCCEPPEEVAAALMEDVLARHKSPLKRIGGYKCLQLITGAARCIEGLRANPAHDCTGRLISEVVPKGNELADSLAATTLELLERHRPYTVLNWAPSIREDIPTFHQLTGMCGAVVTKTLVLEGIARAMGMDCADVPGATGDTDTDLAGKADAALKLLEQKDFVLLHIGGTDEATHRQNPVEKAEFIARVDKELLTPILERSPAGARIMLTSDHAAFCSTAGHTDDPVEALLWEKGKIHSAQLGVLPGQTSIPLLCGDRW